MRTLQDKEIRKEIVNLLKDVTDRVNYGIYRVSLEDNKAVYKVKFVRYLSHDTKGLASFLEYGLSKLYEGHKVATKYNFICGNVHAKYSRQVYIGFNID